MAVPELPEVESVRLSLLPHVRGRVIRAAEVRRRDVVMISGPRGGERALPSRHQGVHLLQGARIESLERRGKQLALVGVKGKSRRVLVFHLGMTGQLFCLAPGAHLPEPTHVHVVWRLDSGARMVFRDPRRFGGVWSLANREALDKRWSELGPDALTISAAELESRLSKTRRMIKSVLLDQQVLAGVGNIYADESLFLSRIPPRAIASGLSPQMVRRLADAIRSVLAQAVESGGSSLSDGTYVNADREPGAYQRSHAVYSRGGMPCGACQSVLLTALISNRTTVWCPRCQPMP